MGIKINLANNLKILRFIHTKSQEEIAELLSVGRATVSKWETGKNEPELAILIRLAEYYSISLDDLVMTEIDISNTVESRIIGECKLEGKEGTEPETNRFDMFPRANIEEADGVWLFRHAYEMDVAQDSADNNDHVPEIAHDYWDALDLGVAEAGVNLLRMLILTQLNINYTGNEENEFPFQKKIEYIINRLGYLNHPGGAYYEALGLIYGAIKTEKTDDENFEDGLRKMYACADEGNGFAYDWVIAMEEGEEGTKNPSDGI